MIKQTKITIPSIFFLTVVVLHLYGLVSNTTIAFYTKPFLMISLVIVYLTSTRSPSFWYVSALFFSFWGDVLLLFKESLFVYGLASFLLAHLFFIKVTLGFLQKISLKQVVVSSFPFVIFLFGLLYLIKDNLGVMLIPVVVYGITISSFGAVALLNYINKKTTENLWLFLGAVFFIASDGMIAIHRFYEPQEIYSISIMITYIVAQYLICKAIIVKTPKH